MFVKGSNYFFRDWWSARLDDKFSLNSGRMLLRRPRFEIFRIRFFCIVYFFFYVTDRLLFIIQRQVRKERFKTMRINMHII